MGMRRNAVTVERLRELVHYDPETGVFTWRRVRPGLRPGKTGGARPDGYVRLTIDGVCYLAHRLAWLYVTGNWPVIDVDHWDGDHGNNRFSNLREATQTVNTQNVRAATKRNKVGLLGVSFHARDGLWRARIRAEGRDVVLGYFQTPEAAHEAYVAAKRQQHAGCTI